MTTPEPYAVIAENLRRAAESTAAVWQQGAEALADQSRSWSSLSTTDPSAGVQRYFELLTQAIDVTHTLATQWADAVSSMTEALTRGPVATTATAPTAADQVASVENATATTAEDGSTAAAGTPPAVKRAAAEEAQETARAPYLGLSKAALVAELTQRSLPKSGTIEQLISRLVAADLGR